MNAAHTETQLLAKEGGKANYYTLLNDCGNWFAAVQLNGEQMPERQKANIERMATAWNSHDDLVRALDQCRRLLRSGGFTFDERTAAVDQAAAALAKVGAA